MEILSLIMMTWISGALIFASMAIAGIVFHLGMGLLSLLFNRSGP